MKKEGNTYYITNNNTTTKSSFSWARLATRAISNILSTKIIATLLVIVIAYAWPAYIMGSIGGLKVDTDAPTGASYFDYARTIKEQTDFEVYHGQPSIFAPIEVALNTLTGDDFVHWSEDVAKYWTQEIAAFNGLTQNGYGTVLETIAKVISSILQFIVGIAEIPVNCIIFIIKFAGAFFVTNLTPIGQ